MEKTYTDEQIEKIKEEAIREKAQQNLLRFAEKFKNTVSSNLITAEKKRLFSTKFNSENVRRFLEDPQKYEKELRQLSIVLVTLSPQYQQIVNYYSSIAMFVPVIAPNLGKFRNARTLKVDNEKLEKDYYKATFVLENMNIRHEFQKIVEVCSREDIFYGYVHETPDSFYIQQMDSDYCRISSVSDGCFNYLFDFSYFDKNNKLKDVEQSLLDTYPSEFKTKYNLYKKDQTKRWQELDENNTICIKMLEELPFVFPTFSSLYDDLADLSTYKELNRNKTQIDNYKFIGMQLPTSNKGDKPDDFLVDPDTALAFYNMMVSSLPEGVGSFISAVPFEPINFNTSAITESNNVNNAENNVFTSSGISGVNFGKNADKSSGLNASNNVDSARLFKLYRQFERWLNRRLKVAFNGKFTAQLLDVTVHNIDATIDRYLKLAQYGVPVKLQLSALLGATQGVTMGMAYLENDILKLHKTWKPLSSSFTTSSKDNEGAGRPEKEDGTLSDSGEKNKENDTNANIG